MWPWAKLEREIEELKGRIDRLERRDTTPKMLADNAPAPSIAVWLGGMPQWEVTHTDVIRRILTHLGLEVIKTAEKPSEIKLEKPAPRFYWWDITTPQQKPGAKPKRKAK